MTNNDDAQLDKELLEPLRTAVKIEIEGRKLFLESAARVNGSQAKKTFEYLAAEEEKHIERIKQFHDSIEQSGGKKMTNVGISTADKKLKDFNDGLAQLRETLDTSASDIEAYRFALSFENGAEQFYEEQLAKATKPEVRTFYQWLIHEEEMHGRLIESCLKFAEDPASWFKERE